MEPSLQLKRSPPQAGLEHGTARSEGQCLTCRASRTPFLFSGIQCYIAIDCFNFAISFKHVLALDTPDRCRSSNPPILEEFTVADMH